LLTVLVKIKTFKITPDRNSKMKGIAIKALSFFDMEMVTPVYFK